MDRARRVQEKFSLPPPISVPADRGFVEIDVDLLGLEIFFEAPRAEFTAKAGLFVAAPGRFDVSRLHMIDPDDAGAQRLHDAKSFVNVAGPNSSSKAVGRVVGDADGFGLAVEGDDGSDRAKDFFASDARGVLDVVEDRGLDVVRSEEHTSELQSPDHLVCRLLLEKKK